MTIRPGTSADLAVILEHREKMFVEMGHAWDASTAAASREFFSAALADDRYFAWLVEDSRRVVAGGGVVLVEFQPGPAQAGKYRPFAVNMWTETSHRRRGLARRLMRAMVEWARQQGYRTLHLHASDAGRPLYEGLGFEATTEMRLQL